MNARLILIGLLVVGCQADDDRTGATGEPDSDAYVAATAHVHSDDAPAATPASVAPASGDVLEQVVAYGESGNSNLIGYLAVPADVIEPLPGVVVIHEWWGLNDNIRAMTRRLAAEGFVVLAVDLYGGSTATAPGQAEALMNTVMAAPEAAIANIRQAYEYLDRYALAPSIATLGWCLGGTWSLRAALAMPEDLDAMVMYYGQVVTDQQQLQGLNVPILGLFGQLDESIPVRDVQRFRSRLTELGKSSSVFIYPGVGHAFANPSGGSYDEKSADDAWQKTLDFLHANLR